VVVGDTEDTVFKVDRKRHTIKAPVTRQTSEAARMVGLAHCLQYLHSNAVKLLTIRIHIEHHPHPLTNQLCFTIHFTIFIFLPSQPHLQI